MSVPKSMQPAFDGIEPLITDYCNQYLNDEYRELCLHLLKKLCRKRPSPLLAGRKNTWAAAIIYAIERYRNVPGLEYEHRDDTGNTWVELNFTPATTYNLIEEHAYLLCAAAIWILDEILADDSKRTKLFKILPRDDREIDELWCAPDFWHVNYDYELVMSVIYVLYNRNTVFVCHDIFPALVGSIQS